MPSIINLMRGCMVPSGLASTESLFALNLYSIHKLSNDLVIRFTIINRPQQNANLADLYS